MNIPTLVETEIDRAVKMTRKDHRQRWVTMDGKIHVDPVPYRDAVSVCWLPMSEMVYYSWRPRTLAHNSVGAI